jgi:hypothetical protein
MLWRWKSKKKGNKFSDEFDVSCLDKLREKEKLKKKQEALEVQPNLQEGYTGLGFLGFSRSGDF